MILSKAELKVYQPTNEFEKHIQDSYHNVTDDYLDEKECKLISSALSSLKIFDDWLEKGDMLGTRMSYFFAPELTDSKATMVFLTHPLFARDILENREIHAVLFSPITFVTTPVAQFLFTDYPIHIYVDIERIKRENKECDFVDVGGLVISRNNVTLPKGCVEKIKVIDKDPERAQAIYKIILDIQKDTGTMERFAAKAISPGVFQIEEADRNLRPDMKVWDKRDRKSGTIEYVDKGEEGDVVVKYEEGVQYRIPKQIFDRKFIVTSATHGVDIGTAIKQHLLKSRAILNIFKDFDMAPERLKDLNIQIVDLKDRYAETDAQTMKLDKSLFEKGDFFRNNFFVVAHEIVHWLSRVKEKDAYFNDPEEVLGFISAVAYEIEQGSSFEEIWKKVYPKIEWHFHDDVKARKFFDQMLEKAKKIVGK